MKAGLSDAPKTERACFLQVFKVEETDPEVRSLLICSVAGVLHQRLVNKR